MSNDFLALHLMKHKHQDHEDKIRVLKLPRAHNECDVTGAICLPKEMTLHFCQAMLSCQIEAQSQNADNELTKGDVSPVE